jgi:hypothetical protein
VKSIKATEAEDTKEILKFLEFKIESCIYSPTRDLNELRKFERIDTI